MYAKLQSIGAHKGIIISTVGFQRGAVQYAEKHGIALWQICDNHIKHFSASADKHIFDAMRFQLEVEAFLPKHFMLEWDCAWDFPYTQLYPTKEMEQEARIKARNKRPNIE